jgi:hypothetical protein
MWMAAIQIPHAPRQNHLLLQRLVPSGDRNWPQILIVGGVCWLCGAVAAIMEMSSFGGTTIDGSYILTDAARWVQHLVLFGIACIGYRIAVYLAWPEGLWRRVRVTLANVLIAGAIVAVTPTITDLCAGLIDGHTRALMDAFHTPATIKEWGIDSRFFLPTYIMGLCAIALVRLDRRRQIESLQKAELERAYAASRLAVLSAQLQPHFLFNSLHAISELIEEDSRRAGTAVAHLGDFLRYALAHRDMLRVELAAELKGLEAYLALQQVRFGEGLTVDVRASPESLAAEMPPLLLQPLAENAIEHGRRGGQSPLFIRVSATSADGCLTIVVHNSQPRLAHELTPAGFGLGLTNVATRLRAVYGDAAHLRVGPDERGGTSATLHIPVLRRRSAADETT